MAISAADSSRPAANAPREKLGILGGMFDPVHWGHLQAAQQVREHLALDQVWLLPCGVPVHRGAARASTAQRCAMLALAAQGRPWLHVDRREVDSPEPSWTHATLSAIRAERADSALYCLMGADAFLGLPTWRRWQELPALAHLIVSTRPGYTLDLAALREPLRGFCQRHVARRPEALNDAVAGRVYFAPLDTPPLSSTAVRERIRAGGDLAGVLPSAVAAYIAQQGLYQ
ncbi:MAG: nicotinate-nucleotide adenylyltransferase [Pseudomonadales bacterium]|jgi:nicotinate-nucleotide adenylyltransferase|nr:nicotinate-nucleotide adenylyltransferase [Pseudomonadales bacterium]